MQSLDLSSILILGTRDNREGFRILGGIMLYEKEEMLSFLDEDGAAHLVPRRDVTSTITRTPDGLFDATVFPDGM